VGKELRDSQFRDSSNLQARGSLHGRFGSNLTPWFTWIFDQLKIARGNRVLEVGCGPGTLWFPNLGRIPDATFILSDFSAGMVTEAHKQLGTDHRFRFVVCDAQEIPLAEGTCDSVIANHVLFFLPNIPQALSEIQRVLMPGGRFYATTNGAGHMPELGELLTEFDPALLRAWEQGKALSPFDFETGQALLEPWFDAIQVIRYPDRLQVTDPAALAAYVLSMSSLVPTLSGHEDEFRRFVERRVSEAQPFHISKDAGMFSAIRK